MSTDELVQLISAGVLQRLALNLKKNLYARLNGGVSPFEVQGYARTREKEGLPYTPAPHVPTTEFDEPCGPLG